jgi:hypothetical protein
MSVEDAARMARIRELIAKLVPLDSACSNVCLAIRDYEWTISELRKKQDRLLDEAWPPARRVGGSRERAKESMAKEA